VRERAALFDLGGVVCEFSSTRRLAAIASASGLAPDEVYQRLFASGFDLACDRGDYTLEQQCAGICARLEIDRSCRDLADLWANGLTPRPDLLEVVDRVRGQAVTALLSNNGPLTELLVQEVLPDVASRFDHLCFSYQARATKPDPRVFEATLERLGVDPADCVFVDDTEEHVEGARALGIDALRFVSTAELLAALQQRGII
jgi:putative hydrolase of the HAD superfamily